MISNLAFAHTCIEDVYLTILDADGLEFAELLRNRMKYCAADDNETTTATGTSEMTNLVV